MENPTTRQLEEEMFRIKQMETLEDIISGGIRTEVSDYLHQRKIKVAKAHLATLMNEEEKSSLLTNKKA